MICRDVAENLGPYLDGELPDERRASVEAHVGGCPTCRAEFAELRRLVDSLAPRESIEVPAHLWSAVQQRLTAGWTGKAPARLWPFRLTTRVHLATAAAIVLALSVGLFGLLSRQRASASEIDFSVLLDGLPFDVDGAFAKFVAQHRGRRSTPAEAQRFASSLNFATPEELPGGFHLKEVFILRVGANPGVATRYERDGELLAAIFHPPVRKEDFGSHQDYECVVGKHRGHMVAVGEWRMVHLTDPTTCHCVLSRLSESEELPAIMRAVAPDFINGANHRHD